MAAVPTHRRWNSGQSLQKPDVPKLRGFPPSLNPAVEGLAQVVPTVPAGQRRWTPRKAPAVTTETSVSP